MSFVDTNSQFTEIRFIVFSFCLGNIFILPDGQVSLLDCGQVKEIGTSTRMRLAELICTVDDYEAEVARSSEGSEASRFLMRKLAGLVRGSGEGGAVQ